MSGFVNGVAAIGGIAVAVLLSSTALAPAAMRATMILLFLFTDLYALAWAAVLPGEAGHDLLGARTLQLALWLTPAMLAGIWVGPARLRRRVARSLPPPRAEPADADRRPERAAGAVGVVGVTRSPRWRASAA